MPRDLFGNELVDVEIIERDTLTNVFVETMRGISQEQLVSMLYSHYEAVIDFARLCAGKKTGEKISMLFNPHRYATKTNNSKSIIDGFQNDAFLSGLARATLFKYGKCKELLYQVLQLGINGIQYVNEFPPFVAQQIFIRHSAKKILDPCAGWGGRMIGAASVGAFYHGFEPASKTFIGLQALGRFLKSFNNGFDYHIECLPFEEANLSTQYDIALTSPPYYDTEIYSTEETNSCNRYKTFSEWKESFYFAMINKAKRHCKSVVLNVGSRQYDLKSPLFVKYNAQEIDSPLSGKGGLGRNDTGKEGFFLIQGDNDAKRQPAS